MKVLVVMFSYAIFGIPSSALASETVTIRLSAVKEGGIELRNLRIDNAATDPLSQVYLGFRDERNPVLVRSPNEMRRFGVYATGTRIILRNPTLDRLKVIVSVDNATGGATAMSEFELLITSSKYGLPVTLDRAIVTEENDSISRMRINGREIRDASPYALERLREISMLKPVSSL